MKLQVLLFASLKDAVQASSVEVEVPDGATSEDLLRACGAQFPALARYLEHVRVAVNREYAVGAVVLHEGDEVALLPPVAGGSGCLS